MIIIFFLTLVRDIRGGLREEVGMEKVFAWPNELRENAETAIFVQVT